MDSSCVASSRAAFSCALSALYSVIQRLSFLLPYSFINVARNTICAIDGRVVIYATYFGACISRSICTDINRRILHLRGNLCGMEAYVFDLLSTRFLHHCTFSALFYTTRIWGIPALARHRASRTPYKRPAKEPRTTLQRCSAHPANTPRRSCEPQLFPRNDNAPASALFPIDWNPHEYFEFSFSHAG